MGSTLSHEDDGTSERGAHANITIVVSLSASRVPTSALLSDAG
jgi:hypothetical protein